MGKTRFLRKGIPVAEIKDIPTVVTRILEAEFVNENRQKVHSGWMDCFSR